MRTRAIAVAILAAALAGGAGWGAWHAWPGRTRVGAQSAADLLVVHAVVKRGDLLITVNQTGSLVARDRTAVLPEVSGQLIWVSENGIAVSQGDLLAVLDPREKQEEVVRLRADYDEAARQLEEARQRGKAGLEEMRIKLQAIRDGAAAFERAQQASLRAQGDRIPFQEAELERRREDVEVKRRLAAKGLIAGSEVEREETSFRAAEFGLKRDRTDYALKQSQAQATILDQRKAVDDAQHDLAVAERDAERQERMAQNRVDNVKLRLDRAEQDLLRTSVVAPTSGLVVLAQSGHRGDTRPLALGDRASEGRPLAEIADIRHMQVALELDQKRVTDVKVGEEALVEIDALPGQTLRGKVMEIGATARRPPLEGFWGLSTEMTFPVSIDLPPTQGSRMRPGMRANARIIVRRIKDVVTVPAECIFERDGANVVFVERGERYQPVTVKVGESNGDYTAVLEGLQDGQRVALNDLEAGATRAPARAR